LAAIFQKGFVEPRIVLIFELNFGEILAGSAGQVVSVEFKIESKIGPARLTRPSMSSGRAIQRQASGIRPTKTRGIPTCDAWASSHRQGFTAPDYSGF